MHWRNQFRASFVNFPPKISILLQITLPRNSHKQKQRILRYPPYPNSTL